MIVIFYAKQVPVPLVPRNRYPSLWFMQWGTWGSDGIKRNKHANGKVLDGKVVQQMPE